VKNIFLLLIALLTPFVFADDLEVTFPALPTTDVAGSPSRASSWSIYINDQEAARLIAVSETIHTFNDIAYGEYRVQVSLTNELGEGELSPITAVSHTQPLGLPSQPGAPTVRIMMVSGVSSSGQDPAPVVGGDLYDLTDGGRRTIPFSYDLPMAPVDTSTVYNVTAGSFSDLQAAFLLSNRTIVVPAGTYSGGTLLLRGSDLDIQMSNSAILDCAITAGNRNTASFPARVKWSGGNHISVQQVFRLDKMNDLLLNDFNSVVDSQGNTTVSNVWTGRSDVTEAAQRIMVQNSSFQINNGGSTDNLCMFSGTEGDSPITSFIFANVRFRSSAQCTRFMLMNKHIVVDSLINDDGLATVSAWRIHAEANEVYYADCHIKGDARFNYTEYPAVGGAFRNIIDGTFENVTRYNTTARTDIGSTSSSAGTTTQSGVYRDSLIYTIASVTDGDAAGTGGLTNDNTTLRNWDGVGMEPDIFGNTPVPSTYGAQR